MDLFTAIDTRSSSIKLVEPGPTRAQIERIIAAAVRAPDHGKLAPWRFAVLTGSARTIFGNAMALALKAALPTVSETQLTAERDKPLRAPAVIAVAAHLTRNHKVPESEQVQAVAAAVQNMFLAAHALGLGVMWKTGKAAEASIVKQALGFNQDDVIVAFLYLGTNAVPGPQRILNTEGLVHWIDATS
ncbi:MAG: nitroreductase [Candidatus Obscuribacterales bacterium]|nr:nitroreductase [Steroidobacteraceae bacterium]